MIVCKNRKLLIPPEEFILGTGYDESSDKRIFKVDRYEQGKLDLSTLSMYADLKYEDGTVQTVSLTSKKEEDTVLLTLSLPGTLMNKPGTVFVQLRGFSSDGKTRWSSFIGTFRVEDIGRVS